MTGGPIIPVWLALPVALVLMVLIGTHAASVRASNAPPSSKRIRLANSWLSLLTLGLLTAGFGMLDPDLHPSEWMLVWIAAMSMLVLVISLAMIDVINTMRLIIGTRRALQRKLRQDLASDATAQSSSSSDPEHERA